MPLIWKRDEAEELIYQQSLAEPGKRFVMCENSQSITFYINGEKHGGNKHIKVEKTRSKPYRGSHWGAALEEWQTNPQTSFDFMHPFNIDQLRVEWFVPDLSFANKQLSLDFK